MRSCFNQIIIDIKRQLAVPRRVVIFAVREIRLVVQQYVK